MAEPIPGWPDVKLTHSGSRFGPICHNPGLFMSSCPYIKYHSLNATGPDLGQFELEILHDQGTLMGVFVQLQFSTAVRAVNDVGYIASKYFACFEVPYLVQFAQTYPTDNPAIWATYLEYNTPLTAPDFKIFGAMFDKETYSNLCIDNIKCTICSSPDECSVVHETAKESLAEVIP